MSLTLLLGLAAQAAAIAPQGELPRIVRPDDCGAETGDEEIVVCGRKENQEKYRMRGTGRSSAPWRSGESWSALVSEDEQRSSYGSQTVGPFGYLQFGRQQVREWRLEREQMAKARRDELWSIGEAADGVAPDQDPLPVRPERTRR